MTNLEVFKGTIRGNFSEDELKSALIQQGLNPLETFVVGNNLQIDFAKIDLIVLLMGTAQSIRELDYQITERSFEDLKGLIGLIYAKWGVTNPFDDYNVTGSRPW